MLHQETGENMFLPEPAPQHEIVPPVNDPTKSRIGQFALRGSMALLALAVPAARSMHAVDTMPATHVPVTIAGSSVDAQLVPGNNTINIEAMGHAFVHPSDIRIGRKTFGVDVHFKTDNVDLAKVDGSPDGKKIEALVRQFSDLTPERHTIENALRSDIEHRALKTGLETLALEALLGGLYLYRRRQLRSYSEEQLTFSGQDRRLINGVAGLAVGLATFTPLWQVTGDYISPNHRQTVQADKAFADTPLAGWEARGPFAKFIDTSWHSWNKLNQEKNTYYASMLASFKSNFHEMYGTDQLDKPKHAKRILFLDDLQGMDGPTVVIGAAAHAFNADLVVMGGDITDSGSLLETSVLDRLHEYVGNIPIFTGTGRHDTAEVIKLAQERGITVADGKIHTIAGVRLLGAADASTIPGFGVNAQSVKNGVSESDIINATITTACTAGQSVIVVAHDHSIGTPVAQAGCAPTVLTGRYFYPPAPTAFGKSILVTNGSSGGHTFGEGINLNGIIAGKAPFKIIDVDDKTMDLIAITEVTLDPVPTADTSTPGHTVTIGQVTTRDQLSKKTSGTLALAKGKQ